MYIPRPTAHTADWETIFGGILMRLPWDRSYFKLSFYAIFTFIVIYISKRIIDGFVFALTNAGGIYSTASDFLKWVFSVFSVLIGGFFVSYILDPVVNFFSLKLKIKSRRFCVVLVYVIVILLFLLIGFAVVNKILNVDGYEISLLIKSSYEKLNNLYSNFRQRVTKNHLDFILKYSDSIVTALYGISDRAVNSIVSAFSSVGKFTATLFLSFVCAYYFLIEKDEIIFKLNSYSRKVLPEKIYLNIKNILIDMHTVFSGYIRGQLTDAVIMALLIGGSLNVLGIKFAWTIGIVSGFSNIIPYFGAIVGFILGMTATLFSGESIKLVYVAIVIVILQQIDSVVISPKIVGSNVKLSPVAVILSLTVWGKIFGFLGMLFAVPITAVIKNILKRIYNENL
jgi:predicted PurR-regulated permease PerM